MFKSWKNINFKFAITGSLWSECWYHVCIMHVIYYSFSTHLTSCIYVSICEGSCGLPYKTSFMNIHYVYWFLCIIMHAAVCLPCKPFNYILSLVLFFSFFMLYLFWKTFPNFFGFVSLVGVKTFLVTFKF